MAGSRTTLYHYVKVFTLAWIISVLAAVPLRAQTAGDSSTQLHDARDTVSKLRMAILDLINARKAAEKERDAALTRLEELDEAAARLRAAAETAEAGRAAAVNRAEGLETDLQTLQQAVDRLQEAAAGAEKAREDAEARAAARDGDVAELQGVVDRLRAAAEAAETGREEAAGRAEALTGEVAALKEAVLKFQAAVEAAEAERAEAEERTAARAQDVAELQQVIDRLRDEAAQAETRRREAEERASAQGAELDRLRETLDTLRNEVARAVQQVREGAPDIVGRASASEAPAEEPAPRAAKRAPMRQPEPAPVARRPAPAVVETGSVTEVSSSLRDLMVEANRRLGAGDADGAARVFSEVLERQPGDTAARLGLAASWAEAGQTAAAMELVDELLEEDGENAQALGIKAMVVWGEGDVREADRLLERAVRLAPDDVRLRNYRGIVCYERRRFADAMVHLQRAVSLAPDDAESRFNLAVLLAGKPDPDLESARVHYQAALQYGGTRDEELERLLAR